MDNVQIGIIKPRFKKYVRVITQILTVLSPIVLAVFILNGSRDRTILLGVITITIWILSERWFESYKVIGWLFPEEHRLKFVLEGEQEKLIEHKNITRIELIPSLGLSRFKETFKSYRTIIITADGNKFETEITRGEIKNNKLLLPNIIMRKRFDFITYLEKNKIRHTISRKRHLK